LERLTFPAAIDGRSEDLSMKSLVVQIAVVAFAVSAICSAQDSKFSHGARMLDWENLVGARLQAMHPE
jgi:hypothetical protein